MARVAFYLGLAALLLAVMVADYHLLSPRGESGPLSEWILLAAVMLSAMLGGMLVLVVAALAIRDARRRAAARRR